MRYAVSGLAPDAGRQQPCPPLMSKSFSPSCSIHSLPPLPPLSTFSGSVIKAGNGVKPTRGQTVTVHCTGYGKDRDLSKKFWSTKDDGQKPFAFEVGMGKVIKGWDESVIDMVRTALP